MCWLNSTLDLKPQPNWIQQYKIKNAKQVSGPNYPYTLLFHQKLQIVTIFIPEFQTENHSDLWPIDYFYCFELSNSNFSFLIKQTIFNNRSTLSSVILVQSLQYVLSLDQKNLHCTPESSCHNQKLNQVTVDFQPQLIP